MRTAKLTTEPFSCPSCVTKIENMLTKTPGVSEAKVMFNSSRVNVVFDEDETSAEALAQAVTKLGYPVLKTSVK